MKTQTNTIKYSNNTNLNNKTNLNKIDKNKSFKQSQNYKRFFTKAVSFIAIPLMTVSLFPNCAMADDLVNYNIETQAHSISVNIAQVESESEPIQHIIPVNLSLFHTENPECSVFELEPESENNSQKHMNKNSYDNLENSEQREHMNRQRQMSLNIYSYDNDFQIESENSESAQTYNLYATSIQFEGEPESVLPEPEQTPTKASTYRYANQISLTNNERYLVYCIIAGEVGSCSYRDKLLVAESLYNSATRCKLTGCSSYSISHVRKEYQYAGYKDFNAFKQECINCGVTYYEDIIKAVEEVFDNNNMPTNEFVLYFHSGRSSWHENAKTIKFIEDTGAHKYYALKATPEI